MKSKQTMNQIAETFNFLKQNYQLPASVFSVIVGSAICIWLLEVLGNAWQQLWRALHRKPTINIKHYQNYFNSPCKTTEEYEQYCARKKSRFWK